MGIKRDNRRLAMSFSERDLLIDHSRGLAKYARNQGEHEYAISILPRDLKGSWSDAINLYCRILVRGGSNSCRGFSLSVQP
jgi:hypothetical protein